MWKWTYGIGSLIILVVFGFYFWPQIEERVSEVPIDIPDIVSFNCAGGKTIRAMFLDMSVQLLLSDGRPMNLRNAPSSEDDGSKYVNDDESVEFWTKELSAFLLESGTTTYSSCFLAGAEFPVSETSESQNR